ncbi:MAG: GreA/GreB family elongation factor [Gammaproteobacteria bacterium]
MSGRLALISRLDRARLRRLLNVCGSRLIREREQLAALRTRLDAARPLDPEDVPESLVTMHSQARVRDLDSGRAYTITVVLPSDCEVQNSAQPPLRWIGLALLGAREGDEVRWHSHGGVQRLRIEKVIYQPETTRRHVRARARRQKRAKATRVATPHRKPEATTRR